MKNENLVPKVRFKGFSDPWEQRKLGELFNERKEKSSQGELLSVTINSGIVKFDTLDRKNNSSADKSNYRVVRYGDIAYNSMRMWQGASGLSMYNGIVSPAYTVITPRTNTDAGFMAVNFKRKSMIQVFQRNSQGLTSDTWNLKFPVLKNIRISIPKITEQQIITELFTVINNLIAANEDKLEQLKTLKKLMMQKIFSQEWRFKGFTDPWEQRKFSELFFKSKLKNNSLFSSDKIISVATMTWKKPDASRSSDDYMKTYNIAKMGDIVFEGHTTKEFANGRFVENTLGDGIVSHIFDVYSPVMKLDLFYWKYFIHNERSIGPLLKRSTTNARMMSNLVERDVLKQFLPVPSSTEQSSIGHMLHLIDNLIAANEDKLNQLKKLKKYLMQNMFV
ncbi:restriction endonuclease subunit S [Lactiplantibacillus plantarum]|uniref:restriction endonuclease subunit S n=1 Tax=Lactiplantibacillus plantarum TaxID=1590 RepID=UPI003C23F553